MRSSVFMMMGSNHLININYIYNYAVIDINNDDMSLVWNQGKV